MYRADEYSCLRQIVMPGGGRCILYLERGADASEDSARNVLWKAGARYDEGTIEPIPNRLQ